MKFLYVVFILTILQNRLITEALYLSSDIEISEGEGKCSKIVR